MCWNVRWYANKTILQLDYATSFFYNNNEGSGFNIASKYLRGLKCFVQQGQGRVQRQDDISRVETTAQRYIVIGNLKLPVRGEHHEGRASGDFGALTPNHDMFLAGAVIVFGPFTAPAASLTPPDLWQQSFSSLRGLQRFRRTLSRQHCGSNIP